MAHCCKIVTRARLRSSVIRFDCPVFNFRIPTMHARTSAMDGAPPEKSFQVVHTEPKKYKQTFQGLKHIATCLSIRMNNADHGGAVVFLQRRQYHTHNRHSWRCDVCSKEFLFESNLEEHMRARHDKKVLTIEEHELTRVSRSNDMLRQKLRTIQEAIKTMLQPVSAAESNKKVSDTNRPNKRMGEKTDGYTMLNAGTTGAEVTLHSNETHHNVNFTAALPVKKNLLVPPEVLHTWRDAGRAIGTGISAWSGIGIVLRPIMLGQLQAFMSAEPNNTGHMPRNENPDTLEADESEDIKNNSVRADTTKHTQKSSQPISKVLQFILETHGHNSQRTGRHRMFRNRVTVRYMRREAEDRSKSFRLEEGDCVHVCGHYARHYSLDVVSKQGKENVIVEADFIGLLYRKPHNKQQNSRAVENAHAKVNRETSP